MPSDATVRTVTKWGVRLTDVCGILILWSRSEAVECASRQNSRIPDSARAYEITETITTTERDITDEAPRHA